MYLETLFADALNLKMSFSFIETSYTYVLELNSQ